MVRAGVVAVVAAAAVALAPAGAGAQPRPPQPRAPSAPAAPAAPGVPPSPDRVSSSELALALLFVGTRTAAPEAAVVRLADALLALFPERREPPPGDVTELATLLHDGLRRRDLDVDARRRLAAQLTGALAAVLRGPEERGGPGAPPPAPEVGLAVAPVDDAAASVQAALDTVRAALREAGLGEPEIVLIEDEVRRLAPRGHGRRR
jgi:hypothetical protein